MSFFKFRQGGADASAQPPGKKPRGGKGAAASTESVEVMRRRARHRLIGSVVLVLAAVIGFPLVFDTKPRPVSGDIAIEIPARDTTAALPPAAAGQAGSGLDEGEEEIVAQAPEPEVAAPAPAPEPAPAPVPSPAPAAPPPAPAPQPPRPAPAPAAPAPPPAAARPPAAATPAPAPAAAPRPSDADRARALLEGRSPSASARAPAAAEASQRFVVQVGAFADANKALEVRQRIERGGFKTYTQVAQTADGPRTRVRVGPFSSRGEAEQAAGKVKALGLPTSVLGL